ncbi:hypothetical protein G8A07_23970 [Roseateles sp. DAIF2]|uniref:hypothetical protein n=1 Tax=Roseateles sp. DAIF2 TaxID=2714952 RepID=UPI0018A2CD72|nr:hypothetical protein [Roseateles sp. DAIF2]QPF75669.1 hypothetical protein G8A07_23970 [Roseateles sp. DAIF2]
MAPVPAQSRLHAWLSTHAACCFLLMTLAFVLFGLLTLDLVRLVSANTQFLWSAGWGGLWEGGLQQLLELVLSALLASAAYLLFKLCELVLVQRLARGRDGGGGRS